MQDSVTCVRFVRGTHYMFSCSKDGTIKYWDADTFEEVLEFTDHFGDVWGLCVS